MAIRDHQTTETILAWDQGPLALFQKPPDAWPINVRLHQIFHATLVIPMAVTAALCANAEVQPVAITGCTKRAAAVSL